MSDRQGQALVDFIVKARDYAKAGGKIERIIQKADYDDGVMVALYPQGDFLDYLSQYATVGELHLTLAYLGTIAEQATGIDDAAAYVARFADGWPPVHGRINGIGRFCGIEGGQDAFVALFDSKNLPAWRQSLVTLLALNQLLVRSEHGFIPHITLSYIEKDAPAMIERLDPIPTIFDTVYLVWGEQKMPFRLRGI